MYHAEVVEGNGRQEVNQEEVAEVTGCDLPRIRLEPSLCVFTHHR